MTWFCRKCHKAVPNTDIGCRICYFSATAEGRCYDPKECALQLDFTCPVYEADDIFQRLDMIIKEVLCA